MLDLFGLRGHARPPVNANPPELLPVVAVVVGEQCDPRILLDVAEPSQPRSCLRLMVNRRENQVALNSERDRHHMWVTVIPDRCERRYAHSTQPCTRVAFAQPHADNCPLTGAQANMTAANK